MSSVVRFPRWLPLRNGGLKVHIPEHDSQSSLCLSWRSSHLHLVPFNPSITQIMIYSNDCLKDSPHTCYSWTWRLLIFGLTLSTFHATVAVNIFPSLFWQCVFTKTPVWRKSYCSTNHRVTIDYGSIISPQGLSTWKKIVPTERLCLGVRSKD